MPIEIKQILQYKPFWYSLFPPVNQSSQNDEEEDDDEEEEDDDEDDDDGEEDEERVMSIGCLNFDNLLYDPTTNEIIGLSVESTNRLCGLSGHVISIRLYGCSLVFSERLPC